MSKGILSASVVCLLSAMSGLQAQRLFVMPGASQGGNNIQVFAASPLSPVTGFQAGNGTFLTLGMPDGSKYYAISTDSSQSVTKIDSSFQVPQDLAAYPHAPTAAVLTPDGKYLAVAAGNLHIFSTTTDQEVVPGGINVGSGVNVIDVTVSLDGSTFYTLGTTSTTTQINAVDVATHLLTGTLGFRGVGNSISVAPNALIYVTLPGQIIDINPNTFSQNAAGPIAVTGTPGRPAFTTDGQYALFSNETPGTGTALMLVSLSNRAVVSTTPSLQIAIDQLFVIGTNTILGYASSTQTAYQITIAANGSLGVALYPLPTNADTQATIAPTAFAISNEVPVSGISYVSSVYTVAAAHVYQLNPQNGQSKSISTLPTAVASSALSYTRPAITNSQPIILLQYGGGLTLAPSSTSPPLVVRVLDSNGLPLSGATVSFTTNGPGASVSPTQVTTSSNGYAVSYLTAGATAGPVQVVATAGAKSVSFSTTVSTSGGTPASGLTFVSGQGQILPENNNTDGGLVGSHLAVKVGDQNGNPLPNTPVTFLITSGAGTLFSTAAQGGQSQTVQSDSKGVAFVDIGVLSVSPGNDSTRGFGQVQIVASAPGTNSLTFTVTYTPANGPATIQQETPQLGTPITAQVGQIIPGALVYQVVSHTGYPIPGVGVNLSTQNVDPTLYPSATCNDANGTSVLSDATGTITCDLVIGPRVGTANVTANVGYSINVAPFKLTVTPGPAAIVNLVQGNNQSGQPGQKLSIPLVVQVTDSGGNILAGASVAWNVASGSAALSQVISVTDINGRASALATLGNLAGPVQVTAISGSATGTFNLSVVVPSSGIQKISGDGQSAVVSTAFAAPLVVEVAGTDGSSPVAGAIVNFQVTSGSATVNSPAATTDANGQASTTVQAGADAGPVVITATTAGFSVTFNLTVRPPGPMNLAVVNGASFDAGTGISPGGIAVITGVGIVPKVQGLVSANNIVGPLPTTLEGVSVTFGGIAAPIYYVMNSNGTEQVAVQVPFETLPAGTTAATDVQVVITASGGSSATITVPVKPFAPGIFTTATAGGTVLPVAQRPDGSYVSPTNPAQLGEDITLYVTGLGQVTPPSTTGAAGIPGQAVIAPLIIGLNNSGVPLISANYVQGLAGVYAVTFQVPANTTPGSAAPLAVVAYDSAGNFYFSQGISIPVQ